MKYTISIASSLPGLHYSLLFVVNKFTLQNLLSSLWTHSTFPSRGPGQSQAGSVSDKTVSVFPEPVKASTVRGSKSATQMQRQNQSCSGSHESCLDEMLNALKSSAGRGAARWSSDSSLWREKRTLSSSFPSLTQQYQLPPNL